jgi:SAM-dependent methyltransferase
VAEPDWNTRYATGDVPWDSGRPDPLLIEVVRSRGLHAGCALEVGCGTGTNALWLAEQGWDVLGVDVSPLAIEKARAKAASAPRPCRFELMDFLRAPPQGGPFGFVFDRGCFHVFDETAERTRMAEQVAGLLAPGGVWLSLIGSTEGPPREEGPPRRSAREVMAAIEPFLELIELRSACFDIDREPAPKAWLCLSRRRDLPAQPSTRHR